MADIQFNPYLFFTGNCREAMEFYKDVFGGELAIQTYGEMPAGGMEGMPQGIDDKVMHARLSGGAVVLMGSDGDRKEPYERSFISLSLGGADGEELKRIFDRLAEGGKITMPLEKAMWGDLYGEVTDKFGVDWMVNISQK